MKYKMNNEWLNSNNNHALIPVLSFFTGGGFLDMGFEQAGFDVIWTNEYDFNFQQLYEFGYKSWYKSIKRDKKVEITERSSIESLDYKKIIKQAFPNGKPEVFGIIGGPPCPDFSNGGKHRGADGERGRLTLTYIELILNIKPDFFILENVSGLVTFKKHRIFLEKMEHLLRTNGNYVVEHKILDALDFGVPQHRERVFVVGVKKSFASKHSFYKHTNKSTGWFPWPEMSRYKNALKRFKWPGIDAFGSTPLKPLGIPDEIMVYQYLIDNSGSNSIPNSNDIFDAHSNKFKEIEEGFTSRKSFKRLHRYRYSPTACYGNNEVHLHPWLPRRLSLRESMRIQGIPDSYELPENATLSSKFKLVSNGVPVPLAYNLAIAMKSFIHNYGS